MHAESFFWYDYETTGTDTRRDRPVQFAGQRTTLELQPIGEPISIFCQPAPDILPHPAACLITGITPQYGEREGLIEAEFAARVHEQLGVPGTCSAGFNSIRFDDEFNRNLFYRNFFDPYEHTWKDGNARWDILDLARLCYALRPQGVNWPEHAGKPSFKLVDLAAANQLAHTQAHEAASDVETTLALARLLKRAQPRLWDFYFSLRQKRRALALLDFVHRTPLLHVSSRYPVERGCLAMVLPLAPHPDNPNGVIVYDLSVDPTPLLEFDADDIADRLFTPQADLPEDVARIPLKVVHANKSPALAPLSVLQGTDTQRIALDVALNLRHAQALQNATELTEKLRQVFASAHANDEKLDPELAIYQGFASEADKRAFGEVRRTPPAELGKRDIVFRDPRFTELLFRYRARNYPHSLNADEHARWETFRRERLTQATPLTALTLDQYFAEIAAARSHPTVTGTQMALLDQLEVWGHQIAATF